jgi:hypothetical protein
MISQNKKKSSGDRVEAWKGQVGRENPMPDIHASVSKKNIKKT